MRPATQELKTTAVSWGVTETNRGTPNALLASPYSTLLIGWWSYGNSSDTVTPTEASAFRGTPPEGNYGEELSKAKGKEGVVCLCRLSADDEPEQATREGAPLPTRLTTVIRSERSRKGARSHPAIPSPSADPTLAHS